MLANSTETEVMADQIPFKDEPLLLIAIARWMTAGRTSLWHTGGDGE